MLTPQTYYAILFLVSVYAFLRGRSDERIAVATCILATFATNIVYSPRGSYVGVELGVLLVDLGALAAFTFLALRSDRFWPLWVAGAVCEAVCVPLRIEPPIFRRRVKFFTSSRWFDTSRARTELGYTPRMKLREGLARTLESYRHLGWV